MRYIIVLMLILTPSIAFSAPVVTSKTDTINGSGFGTKSQAAPMCWDTFENGTLSANIQGESPIVGSNVWGSDHHTIDPTYDNTYVYSGSNSSKFTWIDNGTDTISDITYSIASSSSKQFYVYYKRYMIPSGDSVSVSNIKQFYFTVSVNSYAEGAGLLLIPYGDATWAWYNNGGGSSEYFTPNFDSTNNVWKTWEAYCQMNELPLTDSGVVKVWVDGDQRLDISDYYQTSTEQVFNTLSLGNMYVMNDADSSGTAYCWYDDVYIDITQARVMVGNTADFSTNTHREIQIPTAWSDTSISVTWNQGSFANSETAYLFVVDSAGTASTGLQGYFQNGTFYQTGSVPANSITMGQTKGTKTIQLGSGVGTKTITFN